jgi:two-component system response regulator AtoC
MPAALLDAELFGGDDLSLSADRTSRGKFERADKGTIFLDEIAAMPLSLQAKLMEVLQEKQLHQSAGTKSVAPNVRILAATSANIERALAERKLREDLYYRLSAFTLQVPPLRQRKAEIVILLRHLMHKLARHFGLPAREFTPPFFDACLQYSWPGNVAELETFVKRYLVAGNRDLNFAEPALDPAGIAIPSQFSATPEILAPHLITNGTEEDQSLSLKSFIQSVKGEAERNAIGTALQKTGWNRKAAARLLQVSYRTLLYKIDQYQMNSSEPLPPFHGSKFFQSTLKATEKSKE